MTRPTRDPRERLQTAGPYVHIQARTHGGRVEIYEEAGRDMGECRGRAHPR